MMNAIDMQETDSRAFRGVAWVGKAALFCLGLLAMLALVSMMAILVPVMLTAIAYPAITEGQRRYPRGRRYGGNISRLSSPRKTVASEGSRNGESEEQERSDGHRDRL
jgi:hypothetical protein